MYSGNPYGDDNMQQQDHQGPPLPPVYGPPPSGTYFELMPMPIWPPIRPRISYETLMQQQELQAAAAAAVLADDAEASPPNYVEVVEQEVAVPDPYSSGERWLTRRRIIMDFAVHQVPPAPEQPPQAAAGAALAMHHVSPEHSRPEMPLRHRREVDFETHQQNHPYIFNADPPPLLPSRRPWTTPIEDPENEYAVYPPLVGSPPAEPPSPASSGSPELVLVTPPMPLPLCSNHFFEPCVTRYSEPSTLRSTQSQKQKSSSRPTSARHSAKPYPQNLPRLRPVSTPPMPPPAHSPAPLPTHSPKRLRTHPPMPLSAHSSISSPAQPPLNYLLPPPAPSAPFPMPHRTHSLNHHPAHAPMRFWVHSPTPPPEDSPVSPPALSRVPLPTHSPVSPRALSRVPLPTHSPVSPPALSSVPLPTYSPEPFSPISLLNIPMPPQRHHGEPTPVHIWISTAPPSMAFTAMRSAVPMPMSPTAPALPDSSYIPYPTAPLPVNHATPAPARHHSAYVDLESLPQYMSIHPPSACPRRHRDHRQ